jgi:hypothetical protein
MVLNRQDLAEDFGCKDGKFPKGKPFVFKKNWRRGRQSYGGDALWYVTGQRQKRRTLQRLCPRRNRRFIVVIGVLRVDWLLVK